MVYRYRLVVDGDELLAPQYPDDTAYKWLDVSNHWKVPVHGAWWQGSSLSWACRRVPRLLYEKWSAPALEC